MSSKVDKNRGSAARQKTGGRKRGTPNKITASTRKWIADLIDNNRERLERDLVRLSPKDRWALIERLLQYSIPKLQNTEYNVDLNNLTDEQLDTIIEKICNGEIKQNKAHK